MLKNIAADEYPTTMTLDQDDLKEIKNWKIGEKYTIEVNVTLTALRTDLVEQKEISATLVIDKVKNVGKKSDLDRLANQVKY